MCPPLWATSKPIELLLSAKALQDIFALIKTAGTTREALDRLLTFQEFHRIINLDAYYALDERYRVADDKPS